MSGTAATVHKKHCENPEAAISELATQQPSQHGTIRISKFRQRYEQAKLQDEVLKAIQKLNEPVSQSLNLAPLSPPPSPSCYIDRPELPENLAENERIKYVDEQKIPENVEDDSPPAEFCIDSSICYLTQMTSSPLITNPHEAMPDLVLSRFVTDVYSNFMKHKLETLDVKSPAVDFYSSWEDQFKSILHVDPNSAEPEVRNQFKLMSVILKRRLDMAQDAVESLVKAKKLPAESESYEDQLGNIFELPSNLQDELSQELANSMKKAFERCKEEYLQLNANLSLMEAAAADTVVAQIARNYSQDVNSLANKWSLQSKELKSLSANASTKITEEFQGTWKPHVLTKFEEILQNRVSKAIADIAVLNESRRSAMNHLQENISASLQVYNEHMKQLTGNVPDPLEKFDEFHNVSRQKATEHFQTSGQHEPSASGTQSDENYLILILGNQLELQLREARCSMWETLLTEAMSRQVEENAQRKEDAEKFKAETVKAMEQEVIRRVQAESQRITAEKSSELQEKLAAAPKIMEDELQQKVNCLSEEELYGKLTEKYNRQIVEQFDAKIREAVTAHRDASSEKIKALKSRMQQIIHERMAIVYEGMILSLPTGNTLVQQLQSTVQSAETHRMIETELTTVERIVKQELQKASQAVLLEAKRQLCKNAQESHMRTSIAVATAHEKFEREVSRILQNLRANTEKRQVNILKKFEADIDHKIQELLDPSEGTEDPVPKRDEIPAENELSIYRAPQRRLVGNALAFHVGLNGTTVGYLDPSTGEIKVIAAVKNCFYLQNGTIAIPFTQADEAKLGQPAFDFKRLILENPVDRKYTISDQSCSWEARIDEILARFFVALKNKAQRDLQAKFTSCVLAVSQCLNNSQRIAVVNGATIAGFQNVTLTNYTNAIALAYLMEASKTPLENLVVIYPKTNGADVARFIIRHGELQRRHGDRATKFLYSVLAPPVLEPMTYKSALLNLTEWLIQVKSTRTTYLLVGRNGTALDVMTHRLKTIFRASPVQIKKLGAEAVLKGVAYLGSLRSETSSPNHVKTIWSAKLPPESKLNVEEILKNMVKHLLTQDPRPLKGTTDSNNVEGTSMTKEEVMRKRDELQSQQDKLRLPSTSKV